MECLLSTDILLKSLNMFSEDIVTPDLAELLLNICLESEQEEVMFLASHLIHLLCTYQGKPVSDF